MKNYHIQHENVKMFSDTRWEVLQKLYNCINRMHNVVYHFNCYIWCVTNVTWWWWWWWCLP